MLTFQRGDELLTTWAETYTKNAMRCLELPLRASRTALICVLKGFPNAFLFL
jgi:hypothetical protein